MLPDHKQHCKDIFHTGDHLQEQAATNAYRDSCFAWFISLHHHSQPPHSCALCCWWAVEKSDINSPAWPRKWHKLKEAPGPKVPELPEWPRPTPSAGHGTPQAGGRHRGAGIAALHHSPCPVPATKCKTPAVILVLLSITKMKTF